MKSVAYEYCRAAQGCSENMAHFMLVIEIRFVHIQCSKSYAQINLLFVNLGYLMHCCYLLFHLFIE